MCGSTQKGGKTTLLMGIIGHYHGSLHTWASLFLMHSKGNGTSLKIISLLWFWQIQDGFPHLVNINRRSRGFICQAEENHQRIKEIPLPAIPEGCAKWFNLNLLCAYVYINIVYMICILIYAGGTWLKMLDVVPLLAYLNFEPEPVWYVTVNVHVTILTRVKVHGATPTREFSGRPLQTNTCEFGHLLGSCAINWSLYIINPRFLGLSVWHQVRAHTNGILGSFLGS